jgi:hypothetical protein
MDHRHAKEDSGMPTHEEIEEALRQRLLDAIRSDVMTSESVLTLVEAYAWLREPAQSHAVRRPSP